MNFIEVAKDVAQICEPQTAIKTSAFCLDVFRGIDVQHFKAIARLSDSYFGVKGHTATMTYITCFVR